MAEKTFRPMLTYADESHRSIFKKYRAIFEYFDAVLVGLTATLKTDVDRNTYDFFEMENVAELTKPPFDKPVSFIRLFAALTGLCCFFV